MKALTYQGPFSVAVENLPEPAIEMANDAVVRITTTNICGSDLHMYEGRTDVERGKVLGHENMGIVVDVGPGVAFTHIGDRVSVPFNIACGSCRNCQEGWTSYCTRTNPVRGVDGAAYGYADMGPYDGGQAEYLRVPFADFNLLPLPRGTELESDFAMLSDIFPTAYHACELGEVGPGGAVAIFGGGPVGLLAVHSAFLRGAAHVYLVDQHPDRLRLAQAFGARPVDLHDGDPVEQILEANGGMVDRGIDAVGYQAHDATGTEHPSMVLDSLVRLVRPTGALGVVGVYVPWDPGAADAAAKEGRIGLDYGTLFAKGLRMGTGQAPVKRYNRELRDLIMAGRAHPSKIVSHELSLDDAPEAYAHFDRRDEGWTKVLLHPTP